MKTLIAYYSWSGNTKRLANRLHELLANSDIFEIKLNPADEYPSDMMATAYADEHAKQSGQWPKINQIPDLKPYDQLLVGGPVWTWDLASPVIAFLNQIQDYPGIVRPFYTSVGNSQRYAGWFMRRAGQLTLGSGFDAAHDDLSNWLKVIEN